MIIITGGGTGQWVCLCDNNPRRQCWPSVLCYKTRQNDLQRLEQWDSDWNMDFYPGKCSVLPVTKSKSHSSRSYPSGGVINQISWCDT